MPTAASSSTARRTRRRVPGAQNGSEEDTDDNTASSVATGTAEEGDTDREVATTRRKSTRRTAVKRARPAATKKTSASSAKNQAKKRKQAQAGEDDDEENEFGDDDNDDLNDDTDDELEDDEKKALPTSYFKLFHLLLARRYPEYDAMMNWIHKDPSFNTNDDVRRIAKCRNHLNKWFRAMNRALEPAGLEVVIVKDEEDNNRKYFSIVNLMNDDLVWDEKGARNTGFDAKELRAMKELFLRIRDSEENMVDGRTAEKVIKKEGSNPRQLLKKICEEGWFKNEGGNYTWGIRAKASNVADFDE